MVGDAAIAHRLLPCLQRAFPAWLGLRVSGLTRISSGWECEVYSFALEGEEGGEPRRDVLVLRVYPSHDGAHKARREFDVMRRVGLAGYPVPRVLALSADDSPLGQPFVVMDRIEGPTLGALLDSADPDRRHELLALFCRLFADLHAVDWRPFVPDPARYQPARRVLERLAEWRGILHGLGKRDFDHVLDWLEAEGAGVALSGLAVTHGDFHPWNILIGPAGKPSVIDWTQADVADPRLDLAWTLVLMLTVKGPAMREAVLRGYERAAGVTVEDLWYFEAAASLKRVVGIWMSLTEGPEKVGMRPGAAEMMRQTGPHLATAYSVLRDRTGLAVPAVESLLASLG